MSCDHRLIAEYTCEYLEGTLSPTLRAGYERALRDCPECRAVHEQALEFQHLSSQWQDRAVPDWHRARFAAQPPRQRMPWLSWSALAASCLALVMVVLQLEISTENGLLISFGGSQSEARTRELLARELEAFRAEQEILVEAQLADFAASQNMANQLVLAEWLDRSRDERRQDLNFIMSAWESQRFQDRRQIDRRLNSLADNQIESNQYLNDLLQTVAFPPGGNL